MNSAREVLFPKEEAWISHTGSMHRGSDSEKIVLQQ